MGSGRWWWRCAVVAFRLWLLALLLLPRRASAVELHTLIDEACHAVTGIVVLVDEHDVVLVDLAGHSVVYPHQQIAQVVLHKALENPIESVVLSDVLRASLFDVYLSSTDAPAFTGWPVQFIEELIVFFDIEGKTHVLALEDIYRLRRPEPRASVRLPHQPVELDFPADYVGCPGLGKPDGLAPSRIIGDRVKVSAYFDTFRDRYLDLDSFRERTHLYAKPFLFDERTRLGLLYMRERRPLVPIYIHWSSGRPYAFQSFLLVGGAPIPWLPTVDPQVVVWSDLKSHLFHATFLANPFAIPAGSPVFGGGAIEPRTDRNYHTEHSFNYLILMGADYGPWSLSAGTYYPARFLRYQPYERDVRARRAALVFRARAVFEYATLSALYFRTRQGAEDGAGLGDGQGSTFESEGTRYALQEDAVRLRGTLELFDTLGSLDVVASRGHYDELPTLELHFRHLQFGASLSREFGHYVRMNVHVNHHVENNEFDSEVQASGSSARREFDYGGAFEFQF